LVFSPKNPSDGYELLDADFQLWVECVHEKCGSSEITRYKLSWVSDWVLDKALQEEVANWKPIVDEVLLSTVPCNANIVSSHTFYHAIMKDDGKFRLKARIVPHGNRDRDKDLIRGHSEIACHSSYRTVMALSVVLGLKLFKVDFTAAFLKNSLAEIYMFTHRATCFCLANLGCCLPQRMK
jgi:hypothetical protein